MPWVIAVGSTCRQNVVLDYRKLNVHIRTAQLDIIKGLFIHELMYQWVVLRNNIKIYIKTAPTYFGVNSYTVVRESINLCLLKLQLLK